MGIFQKLNWFAGGAAIPPSLAPLATAPSGMSAASMAFTAGSNGAEQKMVWARYNQPWSLGSGSAFNQGGYVSRERHQAASVATDFATSNPLIATILENLTTHNVGTGLTLSSKLDAEALNITPKEARALSSKIEKAWKRYADNPVECDLSGRFDLHNLAAGAFETFLRTGEVLAVIDWRRCIGARTKTKVSLLDPVQLDNTRSMSGPGPGNATFQGVTFDGNGRVVGYWIRPLKVGHMNTAPMSVYVRARSTWGRQMVVHLFQLKTPGQVRGLSPLVAALTPSQEKSTLGEFTLDAALLQTQYALTIESDLPPAAAMNGLRVDDGMTTGLPGNGASTFDPIGTRLSWYQGSPINAAPGVINHLAVGDKLKMNRAQTPNDTFQPFDKSLARSAAKAAGTSYEDASGDFSDVNFSASRMANETPHRINMRRRKMITEVFYSAVFAGWLEEAIETGAIELPKNAPPFYAAREAYTEALWLGLGRVQPDPLKAAQATKLEIELGLTTLTDALAERGRDFEIVLEERKAEREQLREAGLIDINTDAPNGKAETVDVEADQPNSLPGRTKRKQLP